MYDLNVISRLEFFYEHLLCVVCHNASLYDPHGKAIICTNQITEYVAGRRTFGEYHPVLAGYTDGLHRVRLVQCQINRLEMIFLKKNKKLMRRKQWRQREFKVGGGDEATKGMSPFPLAPGEGSGRGKFFCDLEMAYFDDSEVLNLKVFSAR